MAANYDTATSAFLKVSEEENDYLTLIVLKYAWFTTSVEKKTPVFAFCLNFTQTISVARRKERRQMVQVSNSLPGFLGICEPANR